MPKGANIPQVFTVANIVTSDKATGGVFTGNLKTLAVTATGRAIPIADSVSLVLNVTTLTGDGAANLRVFLQDSYDGGTTWTTCEQFAAVTSSTDVQRLTFRATGLGNNESAVRNSTTTGTNTAIAQNLVMATDHRVGWLLTSTTVASATFVVAAIVQPYGSQGA